ncbi:dual specificity protein phosphatase family protein [Bdellovibrio sp. HCB288]|uniref:dual specificity protein phosphatase family protein n=1 Tax=Bdellovibrio sp. HCB288 TaxID=3394355 RepID=UPI0039B42682
MKILIIALSLLVFSPVFASDILGPNFHEVEKGELYRSAQLDGLELKRYIKKHGIQTIINLRGAEPLSFWWQQETSVAKAMNVLHYNIPMTAEEIPHRKNLIRLISLFDMVPRPILIHCQGGADRSGEAAAIYQMIYAGKSKEEALKQLTFKYRHIAKIKPAKRYFIDQVWKGDDWMISNYDPCKANYKYYNKKNSYCKDGDGEEDSEE